jgi:hypothetical protein
MQNNHLKNRVFFSKLFAVLSIAFITFPISCLFAQAEENTSAQINLRIEGSGKTYFDGKISAGDCVITDSAGNEHKYTHSAACGVVEAAKISDFDYSFKDFGFGLFLTRIGTDDTPSDFSKSWSFWLNDDSASVGLDTYSPNTNDSILLAYSEYPSIPLRVTLPKEIKSDQQFTIKVEKRGGSTDENYVWHGTWEPASGATLHINNLSLDVPTNGELMATLSNEKTIIWADGNDFIRSPKSIIDLTETSPSPTPSTTPSPTPTPIPTSTAIPAPSPSPSPYPFFSTEERAEKAKLALNFLRNLQKEDGSIDGSTVTIWGAIAFGANEDRAESIKNNGNHSLLDALATNKPESATDLERLIIALRATGQNPRSFNGIDYIQLLKNKFNNNQFGEETLVNDDIFGILAMLSAGESANSNILHNSVDALIKKQNSNGLWENVDLTSAAIQTLMAYKRSDGNINVDDYLAKARTALKNNQDKIGGFGENSATTAWSIQAIISLGEDPSDWKLSNGNNPWTALLSYQNSNGGFGWKTNEDVSGFMTTYAILALLSSPWPITKLKIQNYSTIDNTVLTAEPSPTHLPSTINKKTITLVAQKKTETNYPKTGSIAGAEVSPTSPPAIISNPETNFSPVETSAKNNTKNLVLELGLANIGIGVATARIISKIRLFV